MIPVAPALSVRPLTTDDLDAARRFVNQTLGVAPFTVPLDQADAYTQWVREPPPTVFDMRWQYHSRLAAWRAGEMVGFLDAATGHDGDHLDAPEHPPHGLLRFLALTPRAELASEAFTLLMAAADDFWRLRGAGELVAFPISGGYPTFQAGAGILPGDWDAIVRRLTEHDWRFSRRYFALLRPSGAPLEEEYPIADLSLVQQRLANGRVYRVYHRRVEPVASARIAGMSVDRTNTAARVAHIISIQVDAEWRNRNLGKWLLRRLLNDAALQGYQEVLAFMPNTLPSALALFVQQGFTEINYRGYTLERTLGPVV
jgi:ribosomal protein S18 acetylase RimI-like enzyme